MKTFNRCAGGPIGKSTLRGHGSYQASMLDPRIRVREAADAHFPGPGGRKASRPTDSSPAGRALAIPTG